MISNANSKFSPATDSWLRGWINACRPRQIRTMDVWAEQELTIPDGPFKGRKFQMDRLPYTRLLLGQLGRWRRHNATGPVQSGKTYSAYICPTLYHLFERGEGVICGVPNLDMVSDKWKKDLLPAIEASNYRDLLPRTGPGSKGGTPHLIEFGNGATLTFMCGGGNDEQRAGASTRVLVITETDKMDVVAGTSREGLDKVKQLEGRLKAWGLDVQLYTECTVTTPTARTWRQHEQGTASRIVVPCTHCHKWVSPEQEHLVGWDQAKSKLEAGRLARFSCPDCGQVWQGGEPERRQMNLEAKLIHRGQRIAPDGQIMGQPVETDQFSFRWSGFNNLLTPIEQLGMEEWEAEHSEQSDQEKLAQKLYVWCVPATAADTETNNLSPGMVRGSADGYAGRVNGIPRGTVPDGSEFTTAFIDLGRRFLPWEVVAWRADGHHVVDYGFHETQQPDVVGDEVAILDALRELTAAIEAKYKLAGGLIDSSRWNDVVFKLVEDSTLWKPSQGAERYLIPRPTDKDKRASKNGDPWYFSRHKQARAWVVTFDTDYWKRQVHNAFLIKPMADGSPASGAVTLFGDDPAAHQEFAKQITAEEYVAEFKPGRGLRRFWKKLHRDNHEFDCHVGNFVARSVFMSQVSASRPPLRLSDLQRRRAA